MGNATRRIVIVNTNNGIAESRIRREAETLANNGCDCHVVDLYADGVDIESLNGVMYHHIKSSRQQRVLLQLCGVIPVGLCGLKIWLAAKVFRKFESPILATCSPSTVAPEKEGVKAPAKHECAGKQSWFGKVFYRLVTLVPFLLIPLVVMFRYACFGFRDSWSDCRCFWEIQRQQNYFFFLLHNTIKDLQGDVYVAHNVFTLEVCYAVAKKSSKKTLVYHSHELEMGRNSKLPPKLLSYQVQYEGHYIQQCDGVVTVCDSIAQRLAEMYEIPLPCVIRNVPHRPLIREGDDVRKRIGLADNVPLLLYVGYLTFNRGVPETLVALKQLPAFHLVCVGEVESGWLKMFLEMVEREGLQNRVHLVPPVDNAEVVSFIRTADVGLILIPPVCESYNFALPNKLFECSFAGLPIVIFDRIEIRKYFDRYMIGEVCYDEKNPDCLAACIQKAYDRKAEYYTPEKLARIYEENCFEQEAKKMLDYWNSIFSKS